jgi:hypothetical protein
MMPSVAALKSHDGVRSWIQPWDPQLVASGDVAAHFVWVEQRRDGRHEEGGPDVFGLEQPQDAGRAHA